MDITQNGEKQTETDKNEHESGTCADQSKLVNAEPIEDLRDLRFIRFGPWMKFHDIVTFGPPSLRDCHSWSFEDILEEVTTLVPKESKIT